MEVRAAVGLGLTVLILEVVGLDVGGVVVCMELAAVGLLVGLVVGSLVVVVLETCCCCCDGDNVTVMVTTVVGGDVAAEDGLIVEELKIVGAVLGIEDGGLRMLDLVWLLGKSYLEPGGISLLVFVGFALGVDEMVSMVVVFAVELPVVRSLGLEEEDDEV